WDDRDFRAFFLRSGGRRRGLVHVTLDGTVRELRTVWLEDGMVKLIDQRYLPFDLRIYEAKNAEDVAVAIEDMVVRGAPAIGATAAYGMAQAGLQGLDLKTVGDRFRKTRPTGQDLFVAIDYMTKASVNGTDLVAAADRYAQEDIDRCRKESTMRSSPMERPVTSSAGEKSTSSWSARIASLPTETRQTRLARTERRSLPGRTTSRSTSRHRRAQLTSPSRPGRRFRSRNGRRRRSFIWTDSRSLPKRAPREIPPSTSRRPSTLPGSSRSSGSENRPS